MCRAIHEGGRRCPGGHGESPAALLRAERAAKVAAKREARAANSTRYRAVQLRQADEAEQFIAVTRDLALEDRAVALEQHIGRLGKQSTSHRAERAVLQAELAHVHGAIQTEKRAKFLREIGIDPMLSDHDVTRQVYHRAGLPQPSEAALVAAYGARTDTPAPPTNAAGHSSDVQVSPVSGNIGALPGEPKELLRMHKRRDMLAATPRHNPETLRRLDARIAAAEAKSRVHQAHRAQGSVAQVPTTTEPTPADRVPTTTDPVPADRVPTTPDPAPAAQVPTTTDPVPADRVPTTPDPAPAAQVPTTPAPAPAAQVPTTPEPAPRVHVSPQVSPTVSPHVVPQVTPNVSPAPAATAPSTPAASHSATAPSSTAPTGKGHTPDVQVSPPSDPSDDAVQVERQRVGALVNSLKASGQGDDVTRAQIAAARDTAPTGSAIRVALSEAWEALTPAAPKRAPAPRVPRDTAPDQRISRQRTAPQFVRPSGGGSPLDALGAQMTEQEREEGLARVRAQVDARVSSSFLHVVADTDD